MQLQFISERMKFSSDVDRRRTSKVRSRRTPFERHARQGEHIFIRRSADIFLHPIDNGIFERLIDVARPEDKILLVAINHIVGENVRVLFETRSGNKARQCNPRARVTFIGMFDHSSAVDAECLSRKTKRIAERKIHVAISIVVELNQFGFLKTVGNDELIRYAAENF